MSSIADASRTLAAPATARFNTPASSMLGDMQPALDTALAVGRPTDAAGAATVLSTGASYLHGAAGTLARLDEGIKRRSDGLAQLDRTDPTAAAKERQQLDLLQRLRDRIQLSMERVGDIMAGKDRGDVPGGEPSKPSRAEQSDAADDKARRRREEEELLEQRRRLLAPSVLDAHGSEPGRVASAYGAATV